MGKTAFLAAGAVMDAYEKIVCLADEMQETLMQHGIFWDN